MNQTEQQTSESQGEARPPMVPEGITRTYPEGGAEFNGTIHGQVRLQQAIEKLKWYSPDRAWPAMTGHVLQAIKLQLRMPRVLRVGVSNVLAPYGFLAVEVTGVRLEEHPPGRMRFYFVDKGKSRHEVVRELIPHPPDYRGCRVRLEPVIDEQREDRIVEGMQAIAYRNRDTPSGPVQQAARAQLQGRQAQILGTQVLYFDGESQRDQATVERLAVEDLHECIDAELLPGSPPPLAA